jgi:hypothetical protein
MSTTRNEFIWFNGILYLALEYDDTYVQYGSYLPVITSFTASRC